MDNESAELKAAEQPAERGWRAFLRRKNVEISARRYAIDAMGAMAQGLFASLLIGTIFVTLGKQLDQAWLNGIGVFAQKSAGAAMAVAIGYALKAPPLVLFSLLSVGFAANELGAAGGPLAVYVVSIIAAELGKLVSHETRIDILVTPMVTIGSGVLLSMAAAPTIGMGASSFGYAVMWATELQPFLMGLIVAALVGIALTLPISSAAICAALGLTGLAGGAALAGCCAQMVGFAVMSFGANKWSGLIAQGIGTSMLQMGNIVRKPRIWVPSILAAAVNGVVATCVFRLQMNGPAVSSGMGTCGLVGPLGVYAGWVDEMSKGARQTISTVDWVGLLLVSVVLPALLTLLFAWPFFRRGSITQADLKLDL